MAAPPVKKGGQYPDNLEQHKLCKEFLERFKIDGREKYRDMLQEVANRERVSIDISLDDVLNHNQSLVTPIENNTMRYQKLFSTAIDELMPEPTVNLDAMQSDSESNIYDVWLAHRLERVKAVNGAAVSDGRPGVGLPPELLRRYELHFIPRSNAKPFPLRGIRSEHLGSLVSFKGVVTRITDVQPLTEMAAYICNKCGAESYQSTPGRAYTPLNACPTSACKENNSSGQLQPLSRGSKYLRYQEIRVQELPGEVPVGHIPRSIPARVFGVLTRKAVPGDIVTFSGVYLPVPFEGFRAIRAGLTANTYVHVMHLLNHRKAAMKEELTEEIIEEIDAKAEEKGIYDTLAGSIAPEIYGHIDVKKALLLLLVGGVNKHLADGMKIRGDINVLLMGDPGVAKSQLLKHVSRIAPRAVYTTGKGSTGVGLTAAVTRDPVTGETALEGGALVLADKGICCIDEFDKMEDGDRTAIHEVMEQQSVSIAKAGIITTLNARTAILAAANPLMGRWSRKDSFERNVNLETALLSRFDLIFLMLDAPNADNDLRLSEHVCYVHTHGKHPEIDPNAPAALSTQFLRHYIARTREFQPSVPKELTEHILATYVEMRQESNDESKQVLRESHGSEVNTRKRFCTTRSLLAILRLSQALAKVHLREVVAKEDVEEAIRLITVSRIVDDDEEETRKKKQSAGDYKSAILDIIRKYSAANKSTKVNREDILSRITRRFTEKQLDETLDTYQDLSVIKLSRGRQIIQFLIEG